MNFQHKLRAIILDLFDEIYPSAIPNHSFIIPTLLQSFRGGGQVRVDVNEELKFLY